MSTRLTDCEDFTGDPCELVTDSPALPEEWTEVGSIIGVVYRDGDGQAYTHQVHQGELLAAPGFLLIDSPSIELTAGGLVGCVPLH
jgi:hypothetical protein